MAPKPRFPSYEAATQAKAKADEQRRFTSLSSEQKSWAVLAKVTAILKTSPSLKLDLAVLDALVLRSAGYREFLPNGTSDLLRHWAPKLDNFIKISYSFFDYTLEAKLIDITYDISHLWSTQGFHWHPQHTFAVAFKGCSLEESSLILEQFDFGDSRSLLINPYQASDSLAHFIKGFRPSLRQVRRVKEWVTELTMMIYYGLENNEKVVHVGAIDVWIIPKHDEEATLRNVARELYIYKPSVLENAVYITNDQLQCTVRYGVEGKAVIDTMDLVQCYANLNPAISDLLLVVKLWSMRRAINRHCSSDCLSTLAYTVSVLAYLVAIGIVPNLQATCQDHPRFQVPMKLKPVSITSELFEPNSCLKCKNKVYEFNDQITLKGTSLNPEFCLYSLLSGYFKFMSTEFDLTTSAIDLPHGPLIPRSLKDAGHQTMWISDPFHPNRNLASNLTASATTGTLWEMSRALTILRQAPDPEKLFLVYRPIPDQLFIDMEIYNLSPIQT